MTTTTTTTSSKRGPALPKAIDAWAAFRREYGRNAEQFPATPTVSGYTRDGHRYVRFANPVPSTGAERLRCPETGCRLFQDGDTVGLMAPGAEQPVWVLLWRGQWHPVPSVDAVAEWSMDSSVPTPGGDESLEPDADGSWLRLLCLI